MGAVIACPVIKKACSYKNGLNEVFAGTLKNPPQLSSEASRGAGRERELGKYPRSGAKHNKEQLIRLAH